MNFILKTRKTSGIFFCLLLAPMLLLQPIHANVTPEHGAPYCLSVQPGYYNFHPSITDFLQDDYGFLYFGVQDGIIRYNGTHWSTLAMKGRICLAKGPGDNIWAGGQELLGILNIKPDGSLYLKELAPGTKWGNIRQIFFQDSLVYILSDKGLFVYNGKDVRLQNSGTGQMNMYPCDGELFVKLSGQALHKLIDGNFRSISWGKSFADEEILNIHPYRNGYLIKTANEDGFYIVDQGGNPRKYESPADAFLSIDEYRVSDHLWDGSFLIGTRSFGLIITDSTLNPLIHLDPSNGLAAPGISDFYFNQNGLIWAIHQDAVSIVEYPSAFTFFRKDNVQNGRVNDMVRFRGSLYVASSEGVSRLKAIDFSSRTSIQNDRFERLKEIEGPCYDLEAYNDRLLLASANGLYDITEEPALIRKDIAVSFIKRSAYIPQLVYLGCNNGPSYTRYQNGRWEVPEKLGKLTAIITSVGESESGILWVSTRFQGIFRAKISGLEMKDVVFEPVELPGDPDKSDHLVRIYQTSKGLLFSTSNGTYYYDEDQDSFAPEQFSRFDYEEEECWLSPIVEDPQLNLWIMKNYIHTDKKEYLLASYDGSDSYLMHQLNYRRLLDHTIHTIYPDKEGLIWFGGHNSIIRFDMNHTKEYRPNIRTIITQIYPEHPEYETIERFKPDCTEKVTKYPASCRNIRFEFIATNYIEKEKQFFQTKLEGFEDQWSEPAPDHLKSYSNLSPGQYVFKVRSIDINGYPADTDCYSFQINAPFYRTTWAIIILILAVTALIIFFFKWRSYKLVREKTHLEQIINERTRELRREKERSEKLLANILPKGTADELKKTGRAKSQKYNMATVLFADIQGFTRIAESMNPERLIDELDRFYFHFDSVVEKYNIEKIKTIGDAYMAAGGIPIKNRTNPVEVVLAAIEMQHYMHELKELKTDIWDLRIGIHTGAIIAGVVGQKKLSYDIWGDSVNTASRMESSSEPGKINISGTTYELVKDFFICTYRGRMPVKYKGDIDMYFVDNIRPELSLDLKGVPNKNFHLQLQLLRILDLEEVVFDSIEEELPAEYVFHDAQYISHVYLQAELIARAEGVNIEEMLIIRTAALLQDIGYLTGYDRHEEHSAHFARELLPEYKYTEDQIERVCDLIRATEFPLQPRDRLERILCDAIMDYMGRVDYITMVRKLYDEESALNNVKSLKDWKNKQILLLEQHSFYTETAKKLQEVDKKEQIKRLQDEFTT